MLARLAPALALVLAGASLAGCGYPCVEKCEEAANQIALYGLNPETGETGGMDEDTLCDSDVLRRASTCEECRQAFIDLWSLESERQICDCLKNGDQISYIDAEDCSYELVDATDELCEEVQSEDYDARIDTCLSL